MLTVEGRRVAPVTAAAIREAAATYTGTVLDLGTGDGRFVLATAAARPEMFVLGIDANAAGMAESSRRAARRAAKGGLPNARFVVGSAETLGEALPGVADELHVHFPWGSLLRGIATADPAALANLAAVARPGAPVTILFSVADADAAMGLAPLDDAAVTRLAASYAGHGLEAVEARRAEEADLAAAHSSWAKRLEAGRRRRAWLVRLRRA